MRFRSDQRPSFEEMLHRNPELANKVVKVAPDPRIAVRADMVQAIGRCPILHGLPGGEADGNRRYHHGTGG